MPDTSNTPAAVARRREPQLSNIVRPAGMTLVQWQVRLRQQAASSEEFAVSEVDVRHTPGLYRVYSVKSRLSYQVSWYGRGHQLNSCSCMDFKTSRLGMCKHTETVRLWVERRGGGRVRRPNPSSSVLYMDYTQAPVPRIYYGEWELGAVKEIFAPLTDADGRFRGMSVLKIPDAVRQAREASPAFVCKDDVLDFASRRIDDVGRNARLDEVLRDKDWCGQFFVRGVVPYAYQREGIEFAARAGRCVIADEMGLGKTLQSVGAAMLLHREGYVSSVLVICPTSLKYQWQHEIKAYTGEDATVIEGSPVVRKGLYAGDSLFKIVSYNTFNNDVRTSGDMETDMVIMDEVQRLKNWNTQIARSARRLRSDYAVILSGTPLENKLEELYSIVQLVDQYVLGPYYLFRDRHIVTSDSGKVTGYKDLNSIGKTLEGVLLRRSKSDVSLQLPARMDQNLLVPMTKEQMAVHNGCKELAARIVYKWRRMRFLSETDRRRLLAYLSQMRMACDSTFVLDQRTRHDTKVDETLDILDSILGSGDEKVVIFSGWERMTRLIAEGLEARGIAFSNLNGSVPSPKRKEIIGRFETDPAIRVFLSTDTGATGLNLQAASYVINLDLPWNPAVLEQRVGRVYRIGQRRNVQVINLVSVGTIEENMLTRLRFKTDLFDGVLNGGEDSVFLDDNKLDFLVEELGVVSDGLFPGGGGAAPPVVEDTEEREAARGPKEDAAANGPAPAGEDNSIAAPEDSGSGDRLGIGEDSDVDGNLGIEEDGDIDGGEPAPRPSGTPAEEIVSQGVSFVGKLLEALQDPDSTRELVDALVKEDPQTGRAAISIPVSGKDAVLRFAELVRGLLSGNK